MALRITVDPIPGGWRAYGVLTLSDGRVFETAASVRRGNEALLSGPLEIVIQHELGRRKRGDDYEEDGVNLPEDPAQVEAVKQALDQLLAIIETPALQAILPPAIKVSLFAIKKIREQVERSRGGDMGAGFAIDKLAYSIKENPIICGAVAAQRLFL